MKRSLPTPGNPPRLTPKTGRPSKALKGLAVHDCTYKGCGKTYTRKEHLLRHERTHRNELPYVCNFCGVGYARQDLLKRHASLKHGQPHSGEIEPGRSNGVNFAGPQYRTPTIDFDQPYRPLEQNAQSISSRSQTFSTPSRQSSTTTQQLSTFSHLQISQDRNDGISYSSPITLAEPNLMRQLPVPWGALRLENKEAEPDVDLLRAASYGDLTEIRKFHLKGVDVLATGKFENGDPKSALFAAAVAIKSCFMDIERKWPQIGPGYDAVWRDINAKVGVIRYLEYHGAVLNTLNPTLFATVQRALQGPPALNAADQRTGANPGYRLIAAASPDVKLAPMNRSDDKPHLDSFGTASLGGDEPFPDDSQAAYREQHLTSTIQ